MFKMNHFIIKYFLITMVEIYGVNSMTVGEPATEGQFKSVVSIQRNGEHYCSGTIIDEMHIVTAAHAIIGMPPSFLSVVAGKVVVMPPWFDAIPIQQIHVHSQLKRTDTTMWPHYDSWENDIAVLKLSRKLTWGPNIAPAPLMDKAMVDDFCDICIMPGWNYAVPNNRQLVGLFWNFVSRKYNIDDRGSRINLADHQRCIGDVYQLTVIKEEDIGVPIVCSNYVVGFVVKGGEVPYRPSIFLEIFPYSGFLLDIINDGKVDARQGEFMYSVTIWYLGIYLCSGIIYDALHIITARHCVSQADENFLNVIAGLLRVEEDDYVQKGISVAHIEPHGKIESSIPVNGLANEYVYNDIAILTLSGPLIPDFVGQLQLADTSDVHPDHICRVLRWITEDNAGDVVRKLKSSPAVLLERQRCEELGAYLDADQFCAVNPYSKILAEKEDIGNPIICEGKVIGIIINMVLASHECMHLPFPVIFLAVRPYESYIKNMIGEN